MNYFLESFVNGCSHTRLITELKSAGKRSIRVDCGPADGLLNQGDGNHDDRTATSSYTSYESTETTATSTTWYSVTSLAPAAETSATMTTAGVTSSYHVTTDDYPSSSTSVNVSCEFVC